MPLVKASEEGTATSPADLRAEDRLLRPIGKKDVSRTIGDERDIFTVSNPMTKGKLPPPKKAAGRKTRRNSRKAKKVSRRR